MCLVVGEKYTTATGWERVAFLMRREVTLAMAKSIILFIKRLYSFLSI